MSETRKRKSQSPYQKYGKSPHRYSDLYQRWRSAVIAGRKDEAEQLGRQHTRRFAYGVQPLPEAA